MAMTRSTDYLELSCDRDLAFVRRLEKALARESGIVEKDLDNIVSPHHL